MMCCQLTHMIGYRIERVMHIRVGVSAIGAHVQFAVRYRELNNV